MKAALGTLSFVYAGAAISGFNDLAADANFSTVCDYQRRIGIESFDQWWFLAAVTCFKVVVAISQLSFSTCHSMSALGGQTGVLKHSLFANANHAPVWLASFGR